MPENNSHKKIKRLLLNYGEKEKKQKLLWMEFIHLYVVAHFLNVVKYYVILIGKRGKY